MSGNLNNPVRITIPLEAWEPTGTDKDDPRARLLSILVINDVWMHLEAWAVTNDGWQNADDTSIAEDLHNIGMAMDCDAFATTTIEGREYVLIAPHSRHDMNHTQALRALLQEVVDGWPEFDMEEGDEDSSWEISGADMVEWVAGFRDQAKKLLAQEEDDERKVIIIVEGGGVTHALADHPGVDVAVIDYETGGLPSEELCKVPQYLKGDETEDAFAFFEGRAVMPARVAQLWEVVSKYVEERNK